MATVGTSGGHQLLLGIADDLQAPQSQLLDAVITCLTTSQVQHGCHWTFA